MKFVATPFFVLFCSFTFLVLFAFASSFETVNLFGESNTSFFKPELIVLFLLAEPHFAFTIPLLFGYRNIFLEKKIEFIYIPLVIVVVSFYLFFNYFFIFSIIFLVANVYHVNRQSYAFFSMQAKPSEANKEMYEWLLHIFFIFAYVIHISYPEFKSVATFAALIILIALSFVLFREKNVSSISRLSFLQGFLIWLPIIWFNNIIVAFAVGISIHYLQYLFISWKVCSNSFKFSSIAIVSVVLIYTSLSASSLSGIFTNENISLFIFIPTVMQLLHFYYDGFIWRRTYNEVNEALKKAL